MADVNYRKDLADKLRKERAKKRIPLIQKSGSELAQNLLKEEKKTDKYNEEKVKKIKENCETPERLDRKTVLGLIEKGQGEYVAQILNKFEGLDYNEIADKLINRGKGEYIIQNLDKFKGLDHNKLAGRLIARGEARYVVNNLNKFKGLDYNEIAFKIIKSNYDIVSDLGKFKGLSNTIALDLIHNQNYITNSMLVAHNLKSFEGFGQTVAKELIHY